LNGKSKIRQKIKKNFRQKRQLLLKKSTKNSGAISPTSCQLICTSEMSNLDYYWGQNIEQHWATRMSRALPTCALILPIPNSSQFFYKFSGPECKFSFPESFGHTGGSTNFYKSDIFGLNATFLAT
jgi:hypothetical protein